MANIDKELQEIIDRDLQEIIDKEFQESISEIRERLSDNGIDIDYEIQETKNDIANEKIWLMGSYTEEDRKMHENNLKLLEELLSGLEKIRDVIEGE